MVVEDEGEVVAAGEVAGEVGAGERGGYQQDMGPPETVVGMS